MTLIPLRLPPGVFRNGTTYQSKGRWFDANLVRWIEGAMQPFGGWQKITAGVATQSAVMSSSGLLFFDDGGMRCTSNTVGNGWVEFEPAADDWRIESRDSACSFTYNDQTLGAISRDPGTRPAEIGMQVNMHVVQESGDSNRVWVGGDNASASQVADDMYSLIIRAQADDMLIFRSEGGTDAQIGVSATGLALGLNDDVAIRLTLRKNSGTPANFDLRASLADPLSGRYDKTVDFVSKITVSNNAPPSSLGDQIGLISGASPGGGQDFANILYFGGASLDVTVNGLQSGEKIQVDNRAKQTASGGTATYDADLDAAPFTSLKIFDADDNLLTTVTPAGGFYPGAVFTATAGGSDIDLNEVIRGMLAWKDNSLKPRLAIGTPTKVHTFIEGAVTDITQSGVKAAISEDSSVFTDETTDANDADVGDVVLVPASPANNDAIYVGHDVVFGGARFVVSTAASDGTITWEYFNGTIWVALSGVTDGTTNFTTSGSNLVTFTIPSDWAQTTVNSQGPFYYIRGRVSAAGTSTALGTQIFCESGITAGQASATTTTGNYGQGLYGVGAYGEGDPAQSTLIEATSWQFDAFGQLLVACSFADGKLYDWNLKTPPDGLLAPILGAPINNEAVVVTPERFIMALGANGDGRLVKWPDQESLTDWTITVANQAGDFPLSGNGTLVAGRAGKNETLLWTTADLWVARFIGGTLIYSFHRVGTKCGAASRHSMVMVDGKAIWMGKRGFFLYDGFVQGIPSEVSDFVFSDINRTQMSKIAALSIAEFREVLWFYPSAISNENDRYVLYNWAENTWSIGALERTAGVDSDAFDFPIMADSLGAIYDHERGTVYLDTDDSTILVPSAESGPVELGEGDQVYDIVYLIPDEKTLGDVQAVFFTSFFPNEAEVQSAAFTLAKQTSLRLNGRQIRVKVQQVSPNWRVGTIRLDVEPGGRR